MKILSVVGARPNFMKVAPIVRAIADHNRTIVGQPLEHILVHTGQHYDQQMSGSFFRDLGLPDPDVHLGAGSGSHAAQTADIMRKFEDVLLSYRPDVLLVVGDVNSTIACALVAAKISFDEHGTRPLIAHVEAGLRSFDRSMPEEVNRIVTDRLADILFVTEDSGLQNLAKEGVPSHRVHFVGNTMIDSLLSYKETADSSPILDSLSLRSEGGQMRPYALLTLHRPANVDRRDALEAILEGLRDLMQECLVLFPAHPRTQKRLREFGLNRDLGARGSFEAIRMLDPLGYLDFLCLMKNASLVVTDSGGVQEETTCLGVPCVTVRENTERPVTVTDGTNVIAGTSAPGIRTAVARQLVAKRYVPRVKYWDGRAAKRIVDVLATADRFATATQQ